MRQSSTLVIVGTTEDEGALLRAQLADLVDVVEIQPDPARGFEALQRLRPSMVLLCLDVAPGPILDLSRRISSATNLSPVVISRDRNPDLILQAMRAGAQDFAYLEPDFADVRRAVADGAARFDTAQVAGATGAGRITAVYGSKGGAGATMIATNLAGALQAGEADVHVALLDLDMQMGDVPVFLDLARCYGWPDLVRDLHRLDEGLLRQALTRHDSGVQVVAQTGALLDSDPPDAETTRRAIQFLCLHYDHLVVDGLSDFGELSLAVMEMADRILLVVTQDIPSVRNAARCLSVFERLGCCRERVMVVVNRYLKRSEIDREAISEALGLPVLATVTNDFPTVIKAINTGAMLLAAAPRSHVARDLRGLAERVRGDTSVHGGGRAP